MALSYDLLQNNFTFLPPAPTQVPRLSTEQNTRHTTREEILLPSVVPLLPEYTQNRAGCAARRVALRGTAAGYQILEGQSGQREEREVFEELGRGLGAPTG